MPALTAEQKKLITVPEVLEAVEELEKEVATRNYEAADKRTKLKKSEEGYAALIEKIKKIGLDPDGDLEHQFPALIEKITKEKGYKPSSEFDTLKKTIETLSKEVTEWKGTAEKEKKESQVEKASTALDPLLTEAFGKAAPVVRDLLKLRGVITLKDGVAGIQNGEEFIPITAEKGKISALDFMKQAFPDLVVTKQKGGSGGAANSKGAEGANKDMVDRVTFETFSGPKKLEYMKTVGQFTDNVDE
jgi:hypothetical protein